MLHETVAPATAIPDLAPDARPSDDRSMIALQYVVAMAAVVAALLLAAAR